jgi:hypothetical protein
MAKSADESSFSAHVVSPQKLLCMLRLIEQNYGHTSWI